MVTYPTSIIDPLNARIKELSKRKWVQEPQDFPEPEIFQTLIDTAFHASLLTEEGRSPGFRLIYCSPNDLRPTQRLYSQSDRFRIIKLPSPRSFTIAELNRIAPAADLTRFLICVCPVEKESKSLCIWGILDVGENWWKFVHHETSGGMPPPNFLTITSSIPGELSFSLQGTILLVLKNGVLSHPSRNPIWEGPISNFLDDARRALYSQSVKELNLDKWDKEGSDDDYPLRFYNFFLERILYNVRQMGHGGTIIMVPDEISFDDPRLIDRIIFKYATKFDYAWSGLVRSLVNHHHYFDLYFPIIGGEKELTKEVFTEINRYEDERDEIDEELQDIANTIASLTCVDGALVITTRYKVLGFGGEIIAASPTLNSVIDASSQEKVIPVDSFGTRHRSAFRFCSSLEESIALIVSSDGGVKAVKRNGPKLLFWPDINEGAMGL
jgi:hypothetical protein